MSGARDFRSSTPCVRIFSYCKTLIPFSDATIFTGEQVSGDVISVEKTPIGYNETAGELFDGLSGCVTTARSSCLLLIIAFKVSTEKSGVPKKMTFNL